MAEQKADQSNGNISEQYRVPTASARLGSGARVGSSFVSEDNSTNPGSASTRPRTQQSSVKPDDEGCCACTCRDIKEIIPSIIILVVGLTIMALFIPYAFASVIRQIQREQAMANNSSMVEEDLENDNKELS